MYSEYYYKVKVQFFSGDLDKFKKETSKLKSGSDHTGTATLVPLSLYRLAK